MTLIGINIVGEDFDLSNFSAGYNGPIGDTAMMMFLRVYALYKQQKIVLGILAFLLLFQVCMNGWLLTKGEGAFFFPLQLIPPFLY